MKRLYLILFFSMLTASLWAQPDRMESVKEKLHRLAITDTTFLSEVDLSVGNMPLGELIRNVAKASNVSISISGDNGMVIHCNLNRARIVDLLQFLCQQYNLDIDVVGNIVSVFPYQIPPPEMPDPAVRYEADSSQLSYDLREVPLSDVVRLIADASSINLVIPQPLYPQKVSGYAVRLPVDEAIRALAESNDLDAFKNGSQLWNIEPKPPVTADGTVAWNRKQEYTGEQLKIDSLGLISVQIQQGSIPDIILNLCDRLHLNYYFISPVSGQTSLYLKQVELHTLLKVLFTGTDYSYYQEEGIYMFGASKEQALSSVRVVQLQNRTVSKLAEAIPADLKSGVQIEVFGDLNSMILTGDQRKVARVEEFLKAVDQTVPLITIEVLIVDATRSRNNEQGLSLGIGENPIASSGQFSPGINLNLSASAINDMLNSFNGFGAINLGKVNANFYANLKLLEASGEIELQSTPKLSTLNGHEAELKSGERRFYKEVNESLMGSQNPIQTSSYTWKSIDADLIVKIAPFVSGNHEITLSIEIEQTEFTSRNPATQTDAETPPPGTSTRSFKSEIRVLNEEMVLLGGIERNNRTKTSDGLPFLARAPILKWIFGQSVDNKEVNKLNVFIKPTVIY